MNTAFTEDQYIEYMDLKAQLRVLRALESEYRKVICHKLLDGKTVGTHNFNEKNFKIKAVKRVTLSLDKEAIDELYTNGALTADEESVIKISYSIDKRRYDAYEQGDPAMDRITDLITAKPAMPELEIEYIS